MSSTRLGLSCAISTPFTPAGRVETKRLADHANWCLREGCDSVTLFGTTGEGAAVVVADREASIKRCSQPASSRAASPPASRRVRSTMQSAQAQRRDGCRAARPAAHACRGISAKPVTTACSHGSARSSPRWDRKAATRSSITSLDDRRSALGRSHRPPEEGVPRRGRRREGLVRLGGRTPRSCSPRTAICRSSSVTSASSRAP